MQILLWTIIGGGITGAVIGTVALMIIPGKQFVSAFETVIIGTGAAILGGFVANLFGWVPDDGIHWVELALEVGFAIIGVFIYLNWRNAKVGGVLSSTKSAATSAAEDATDAMTDAATSAMSVGDSAMPRGDSAMPAGDKDKVQKDMKDDDKGMMGR
jgi:uncharacterized membrane protein YeaQ/YmgE (transglycosylase-associated protein family)